MKEHNQLYPEIFNDIRKNENAINIQNPEHLNSLADNLNIEWIYGYKLC